MSDIKLSGRYKMIVTSGDTGEERVVADWFENLITDQGLNHYCGNITSNDFSGFMQLGSGTIAPAVTDTQLAQASSIRKPTSSQSVAGATASPYYGVARKIAVWNPGELSGNFTEIGIGWGGSTSANTSISVFSRALITENGNPITITILSTDSLTVIYDLRLYAPTADVTGMLTLGGNNYNYTIRPLGVTGIRWIPNGNAISMVDLNSYTESLTTATSSSISGTALNGSFSTLPYVDNSFYREVNLNFGISQGNFSTGIGAITTRTTNAGAWQIGFSPKIPKTANEALSIKVRFTFGRYTP